MRLGSFESIKVCVFKGMEVNICSVEAGCDFTLIQVDGKIQVVRHHKDDETELFSTFRNGDKTSPDLEGFLDGWTETVNAKDCIVYIF